MSLLDNSVLVQAGESPGEVLLDSGPGIDMRPDTEESQAGQSDKQ